MAAQEERVGKPADESEGRLPLYDVTHRGCIADPFELVNVPESLERAVNHFIDKPDGAVELGNASDKALPDAEVAAFESDEVAASSSPSIRPGSTTRSDENAADSA